MKIELKQGQRLWFTSDTHYNHTNICRATTRWTDADSVTRDFSSLQKMNETLVSNINKYVQQDDILIHLGDWSFGGFESIKEFRDRIVCQNVHLVLGNHDGHIEKNRDNIQSIFSSVNHYVKLDLRRPSQKGKVDKFNFVLCHFPIASWDGMNDGVIHTHGHVHLPAHHRVGKGKSIDVGVDGNNLEPIDLDEVLRIMSKQPISSLSLPRDHHVKRLE